MNNLVEYFAAYWIGGVIALFLLNWIWYSAPDLHGVQLGLLMGVFFLLGSVVSMLVTWVILNGWGGVS